MEGVGKFTHQKIVLEIIITKVVAGTREAFVLHKIPFCDCKKLFGRSRAPPDSSALPHSCHVMVVYQHNIKLTQHRV